MRQSANIITYWIKADKGYISVSAKTKNVVIKTLPRNSWDSQRALYTALKRR